MSGQGSGGKVLADICNIFIVGLGQLVQGRIFAAIMFFLLTYICYSLAATVILIFMWIPGVIFHIWAIVDAAKFRSR